MYVNSAFILVLYWQRRTAFQELGELGSNARSHTLAKDPRRTFTSLGLTPLQNEELKSPLRCLPSQILSKHRNEIFSPERKHSHWHRAGAQCGQSENYQKGCFEKDKVPETELPNLSTAVCRTHLCRICSAIQDGATCPPPASIQRDGSPEVAAASILRSRRCPEGLVTSETGQGGFRKECSDHQSYPSE